MGLARNIARGMCQGFVLVPRGRPNPGAGPIPPNGQRRGRFAGRSLALPAVFHAVRKISETAGAMPLMTYRRQADGRDRAERHPAYSLLHDTPNENESAVEAWTRVFAHLSGWGECFMGKGRTLGSVSALYPIEPARMMVDRRNGVVTYKEMIEPGARRRRTDLVGSGHNSRSAFHA